MPKCLYAPSYAPVFGGRTEEKQTFFNLNETFSLEQDTTVLTHMVDSLSIKQAEANVCSGTITYTFATSSCKAKRNHPNICWNSVLTAQLRIGSAFQTLGIGLIKCHSYILYCIGLLNKRVVAFKPVPKKSSVFRRSFDFKRVYSRVRNVTREQK